MAKSELENSYFPGTIIKLTKPIEDKYSFKPAGSKMRVEFVDDAGQIHGQWLPPASGSLAVIIGVDAFEVVAE